MEKQGEEEPAAAPQADVLSLSPPGPAATTATLQVPVSETTHGERQIATKPAPPGFPPVPICIPAGLEEPGDGAVMTPSVPPETGTFPGQETGWKGLNLSPGDAAEHFRKAGRIFSQHEKFRDEWANAPHDPAEAALLPEEAAAIKDYTGGVFMHMNRYLRGNRTFFQKLLALGTLGRYTTALKSTAKLITSGMNRLPAYENRNVYRATHLSDEAHGAYQPGAVITEHGFTSCSKTMKGIRMQPGHVVFVIRSREGKDIQALSISPHEEEVLFRPETRFKVLSKETGDTMFGKARFIYLEELS
jgi:hypothetical protein